MLIGYTSADAMPCGSQAVKPFPSVRQKNPWSFLWLYRPAVPTPRAQAIQVVHMAHAMASRGHDVTLAVEPACGRLSEREVLGYYGLEPLDSLRLHILPSGKTMASFAFRAVMARWVARTRGQGIVYARSKRYAREMLRVYGRRFHLIVEAHEVDSLQARERGEDPRAFLKLEAEVLSAALGVVTNAPGTLQLLRSVHPGLPPALVSQNGTHPSRIRAPVGPGEGIGYVGSIRETKDLTTLARVAARLRWPVTFVGADADEARALVAHSEGRLLVEPPLAHRDVPDRLCRFRVLVLPLGRGLFGEHLSSPLKLWDYLASGVPIVGADVPALHAAAPGMFRPYVPGDEGSLQSAIEAVHQEEETRRQLVDQARPRFWNQRAEEIERFVESIV